MMLSISEDIERFCHRLLRAVQQDDAGQSYAAACLELEAIEAVVNLGVANVETACVKIIRKNIDAVPTEVSPVMQVVILRNVVMHMLAREGAFND